MADDKPFACMEPDCGMCFANEDHLSVHRMKHEMSLSLHPAPGKTPTNLLFVDQTPTPTKFLKNCEEIGLFSELNKNPFEEAFKKATESQHDLKAETLNIPSSGTESDTLHTPTPPSLVPHVVNHKESPLAKRPHSPPPARIPVEAPKPNREPEFIPLPGPSPETGSTISTISPSSEASQELTPATSHILPSPTTSSPRSPFVLPPKKAMLASRDFQLRIKQEAEAVVKNEKAAEAARTANMGNILPSAVAVTTQQTIPMVTNSLPTVVSVGGETSSITSEAAAAATKNSPSASPVVLTSPSVPVASSPINGKQYFLQVVVQMPNGEAIPVQIPAALAQNQNQTQQVTPTQPVTMTTQAESQLMTASSGDAVTTVSSGNPSSYAKQKLKASLQQSAVRLSSDAQQRLPLNLSTIGSTSPTMNSQPSPSLSISSLDSASVSDFTAQPVFKRARSSTTDSEDPDDKRKKFLERNRAAAARCRQKKKNWIVNLEGKAEELQNLNSKLQNEVTMLRSEVAQLKSLLLAHKDCPITQQQRSTGQLDLQTVPQLETQSDSISSTSPSSVIMETTSSSQEVIATSALTSMAAKGNASNSQPTIAPIIINLCPNPNLPNT